MPEPSVLVLEDIDHTPGFGALVGEIHANIAQALNCAGCVTKARYGICRPWKRWVSLFSPEGFGFSCLRAHS